MLCNYQCETLQKRGGEKIMYKPIEINIGHIQRITIEKNLEEIVPECVLTIWSKTGEVSQTHFGFKRKGRA